MSYESLHSKDDEWSLQRLREDLRGVWDVRDFSSGTPVPESDASEPFSDIESLEIDDDENSLSQSEKLVRIQEFLWSFSLKVWILEPTCCHCRRFSWPRVRSFEYVIPFWIVARIVDDILWWFFRSWIDFISKTRSRDQRIRIKAGLVQWKLSYQNLKENFNQ